MRSGRQLIVVTSGAVAVGRLTLLVPSHVPDCELSSAFKDANAADLNPGTHFISPLHEYGPVQMTAGRQKLRQQQVLNSSPLQMQIRGQGAVSSMVLSPPVPAPMLLACADMCRLQKSFISWTRCT